MKSYDEQIDELDAPPPKTFPPDSPMSRYLAEQRFYGKGFIRWSGFSSKKEKKAWHQLEEIYNAKTIQQRIDWAVQHCAPSVVVARICTSLLKHVKPDKTITMDELKEFEP